jgi:hypothetical protein
VSQIGASQVVLFYLFDIADTVDLQAVPPLVGGGAKAARLAPKQATPAYVQYDKPPLLFDAEALGLADLEGFHPRFRVYDYGVISLALSRLEGGCGGEAQDARRYLSFRGGTVVDVARPVPGADGRVDPRRRASAALSPCHEVVADGVQR